MKLHLTTNETTGKNSHLITGYGAGFIEIDRMRYSQNLIVLADKLITEWQVIDFASVNESTFTCLLDLKAEVVLLGTGEKHQFLHPKHYRSLTENGIPLECMTTAAACRTYNILMSEGRKVAAALIL
ncbi:MAG: Mth938-like domain-containing protein [Methylophilaceae bacterium]